MMQGKLIFLILITCSVWYSCKDNSEVDIVELKLSATSFTGMSSEGDTLQVAITCNGSWTASSSDSSWCSVTPAAGTGSQPITIVIAENLDPETRAATVTVSSEEISREISISQEALDFETYHYRIPIIFHVLYKDQTDPLQYVSASRLSDILQVVNDLYQNSGVDLNLSFHLATTDPEGKPMDKPGVEYIEWTEDYPIDCYAFMDDTEKQYVRYIWDPNQYINVMVYNFNPDIIGGLTHPPFSVEGSTFLEGLTPTTESYIAKENLKFPYSVSINSLYINEQSTPEQYSTLDVIACLAHELGHYLGLEHVFSETEESDIQRGCEDTDYCKDTPTYNRQEYEDLYDYIWLNEPENFHFSTLVKRTDCSGNTFISDNIMDYYVSHSNRFTNDQRTRIRHVLTYSPLIPGPKNHPKTTRVAPQGVLDLPMRVVREHSSTQQRITGKRKLKDRNHVHKEKIFTDLQFAVDNFVVDELPR